MGVVMDFERNDVYRLDEFLLRAGGLSLLLVVGTIACLIAVAAGEMDAYPGGPNPNPAFIYLRKHAGGVGLALSAPIALLWAGLKLRRREKRIFAIWKLLRRNAELDVAVLLANSDFERDDLERAVRFLNNKGLGHYVWDRGSDAIQDARLLDMQLHVDTCDACGASISLKVPVGNREIPDCPFCGDPVSVDHFEARRHDAMDKLRAEHRPPAEPRELRSEIPFSVPIFVLLLMFFWPAAVAYAWIRWQQAH